MSDALDPVIPASQITPEAVYRRRRELIGVGLASPLLALAGCTEAKAPIAPNLPKDSPDGFRTSDVLTRFAERISRHGKLLF